MGAQQEVLLAAMRARELVTAEVLKWGELIARAEANPSDEEARKRAQEQGRFVAQLALGLHRRLGG